ncbi:MAG TPA: RNA-binding protein [Rhabdochlamydiaceae bacterium]|jgi:RNA recognition motif-containing protein|nr:RNA-binding protein [Rhabdochlamydiaceae bacterium]
MTQQTQKLYVGSLPYKTTEDELYQIFSQFGAIVSVKIVTDRVTGQSKGFGFVEMEKADEAQKAIESVNGSELGGRTLVVSIARPPQERERGEGGGGFQRQQRGGGGGRGGEGRYRDR